MVMVMLDSPWLKRVKEGSKHQCSNDVLDQVVGMEGSVPRIMANYKELKIADEINNFVGHHHAITEELSIPSQLHMVDEAMDILPR
jgi:hypothetical protein